MNPLSINFYVCPESVSLPQFVGMAAGVGAQAVGLTVRALTEMSLPAISRLLQSHGLKVSSLNSAGYFLFGDAARASEQENLNARLIAAAAELEAQTLVVITGGISHGPWPLAEARARVEDGLLRLADQAARAKVHLGIEPIHPLGILQKGCVNSIADGLSLATRHAHVGLTIDFFHTWWDTRFTSVFEAAPEKTRLVQFCNVAVPDNPADFQREVPATGLLDVAGALHAIRARGYRGYFEFEMFPEHLRGRSVEAVLQAVGAYYAAIAESPARAAPAGIFSGSTEVKEARGA